MAESAIVWGAAGGAGNYRIGVSYEVPPTSWGVGQTTHTQRVYIYWRADGSITDNANQLSVADTQGGTAALGSVNLKQGQFRIGQADFGVPLTAGSSSSRTFTATLANVEAAGTRTASVSITYASTTPPPVPADQIPSVTVERVSDTQHRVVWSPRASTATSYIIQRAMDDSAVYVDVGSADPGSGQWVDNGTQIDHSYRWRIVAKNAGGLTGGPDGAWHFTSPAAPTAVAASRTSSGLRVTWNTPGRYTAGALVEYSTNGGTSWQHGTQVINPAFTEWTLTSPNSAYSYQFRVASIRPYGQSFSSTPLLRSPNYGPTSNTVALLSPPNQPAFTAPIANSVLPQAEPFALRWVHSSPDASAQSAFRLRWRTAPIGSESWGSWVYGSTTSSSSPLQPVMAPGSSERREYQVQTWGAHPTGSAWSNGHLLTISARPVVTILSPSGATHDSSSLPVRLAVTDSDSADAVSSATLTLLDHGTNTSRTFMVDTETLEYTLTGLADGGTYTLTASATSGGLSAEASRQFSVSFPSPAVPIVSVVFNRDLGVAEVSVTNPAESGKPPVETNELYINGRWAADIGPHGTFTDPIPDFSGTSYVVRAVSGLPSTADSAPVTLEVGDPRGFGVHFNFGPGFSQHAWMSAGGVKFADSLAGDVTLTRWDGDELPSPTFGPGKPFETSMTGMVFFGENDTSEETWRSLVNAKSLVVMRTVTERKVGVIHNLTLAKRMPYWADLTLTFQEVQT